MKPWFTTLDRKTSDSAKWQIAKNQTERDDVLTFSVADSDYETAPIIKEALKERVAHGAFGYAMVDDNYRDAVTSWCQKRYELSIDPTWVSPAPKVLNALSVIIDVFTNEGDGVLIQTPVYHVFEPVIKQNRRRVIDHELAYKNGRYSIDYERLDADLNNASMVILCSPHNPVGRVWTKPELSRVVQLCQKHKVLLVSDEIHADLIMPGHRFVSCGAFFNEYEGIILVSAPSKTFNVAGLQIAHTIIKHTPTRRKLAAAYQRLHLSGPNALAMAALKAAYTGGDAWVDAQNKHIVENYQTLKARWESFADDAYIAPLEGTYLAWLDVRFTGINGTAFVEALKQRHGVVLSEGAAFGSQASRFVRLNLACSQAQLKEGLRRIAAFVDETLRR